MTSVASVALAAVVAIAGGFVPARALAAIVEERLKLPVEVTDGIGKRTSHGAAVTLFRDDAVIGRQPAIVIQHGRAHSPEDRLAPGHMRFADASRWFARNGFVVTVPTRVGYHDTGGEDLEDSGPCDDKRFEPGFAAAATQTLAVLDLLRGRSDVDGRRLVVLGMSFGGATSVAVAARNPPGVLAAINISGGAGGNSDGRPDDPCSPHRLERAYARYGASSRVPMLWIYAENDRFWGPALPKSWSDAYRRAGGDVRFVHVPPHGADGHALFVGAPDVWQSLVAEFLRERGFAVVMDRP